jgi:signal transduction histidine kinase/ligand-binding sensor domain-containing protein
MTNDPVCVLQASSMAVPISLAIVRILLALLMIPLDLGFLHPNRKRQSCGGAFTMKLMAAAVVLLLSSGSAFALDRALRISQYAHTAWYMQDGVFAGAPHAITQTADGYIWIGGDAGLVRFDGVRFLPWVPPGNRSAISAVYSLLGGRDGALWIGTGGGLRALKNDHLIDFPNARGRINDILEDQAGTVWVARSRTGSDHSGGICQVVREQIKCFGNSDGMALQYAGELAQDGLGNLWVGSSSELLRWSPRSWTTYYRKELEPDQGLAGIEALAVAQDQSIWVGFDNRHLGLQRIVGGVSQRAILPGIDVSKLRVFTMFIDHHNSLWIGTGDDGLYRIQGNEVDHFAREDGLSGNSVECLYGDAEENLWVVTAKGVDVFRDTKVATISTREGLSSDHVQSVLAARDGSIWIGNYDSLDVLRGNKVSSIRPRDGLPGHRVTSLWEDDEGRIWVGVDRTLTIYEHGRFRSVPRSDGGPLGIVTAISEDTDRNIWAVTAQGQGQRVFRIADDRVMQEFNESEIPATRMLAPDPHGGVWIGLYNGSLARYRAGKLEIVAKDLSPRDVLSLAVDKDGSVWGASRNGLFRWSEGRFNRLGLANGLPCEQIAAIVKDDEGALWLYSTCGVVSISGSEIARWWQHPESKIRTRVFDALDGAQVATSNFLPQASRSPDGRLWFTNNTILQSVDPLHLNDNRLVPPVRIEQVIADRNAYAAIQALHLPARTRDIEIDYTALSFRVPQKVRFRYKLDGRRPEWQDAGSRRQVFFSDLPPGPYTFRVIASNNDGVWNDTGASLTFSVAAAFYQTLWFRTLLALSSTGLILFLYRLRLQQITARADLRYTERLEERTRIARELHDTMLQSFQGSLLEFQAAHKLLSRRPEEARTVLDQAINSAKAAIAEGRTAIHELRSTSTAREDLAKLLTAVAQECADARLPSEHTMAFRVTVEGPPRALSPVLQDELYRIGREVLRNAFRHARAKLIEVEIRYSAEELRLRIRDDGIGIDPKVLETGARSGHWGLPGARERARLIGAEFGLWAQAMAGTEVQITVPAPLAYLKPRSSRAFRLFRRRTRSYAD